MKKVLLISNKVFHYRVANYNYFARRFQEQGIQFIVRACELERQNPFPVDFDFREIPFKLSAYRREIERLKPDVVIVFLFLKELFTWTLMHWVKAKGIPLVYWNKGINLEVRDPGLRNQLFYYVHTLCDGIILYSENERQYVKRHNQHKVFVAKNTVNFNSFPEIAESKAALKKQLGIPFEKVVLFVGRLRAVKKVDHLIEAFRGINDTGVGCLIVGDSMGRNLAMEVRGTNVLYLGEIHDPANIRISQLFKLADVFCIPGDVGLGLNQAFYWGLPVVTERGLQPPEFQHLVDGRNGFVVAEDDIDGLREGLRRILGDDQLRAEFARNARADILREASIETMFCGFRDCVAALSTPSSIKKRSEVNQGRAL